jgi:membrane-associated protein
MELILSIVDIFLHLDKHLGDFVSQYGTLTYAILFLVIFAETGLVITPFLPGDSLLFAAGAIAALGGMNPVLLIGLLIIAAILGDATNYAIGKYIGPKVFSREYRFLKREHLQQTQLFYEKHGGKAIIFARFVPIVRTFAPFVAGIGQMRYSRFFLFNVVGAVVWVASFVVLGYFVGNMPIVKKYFTFVVFGIIFISILPAIIQVLKAKKSSNS